MKALVFVLSLLVAGTAFAGTDFESMSWASLLRSGKYDVDYANKIHFQNGSVWVPSFAKTLCTDGTFIYGGVFNKKVCVNDTSDGSCNKYKTQKIDLIQPIYGKRQRCAKTQSDNCVKYVTVNYVQSPNRTIKILAAGTGSDDNDATVVGVKSYTIPSCGGAPKVPAN